MHLMISVREVGDFSLGWFRQVAGLAERACADAVLFGGTGVAVDPMVLLPALAASTRWIGLGAAISFDRAEPFNVARSFAGADRLTGGRTAWVVGHAERTADFGHTGALTEAERWARAEEGIAVVRKLWDSWEDGAVILDKEAGMFSDASLVHRIEHVGPWFQVRGPLNAPRPLQGHPIVIVGNESAAGLALAGRMADVVLALDAPGAIAAVGDRVQVLQTMELPREPAGVLAARMAGMVADGACHGFDVVAGEALEWFVEEVVPLLQARGALRTEYGFSTLRENLGLARPVSQFAA